MPVDEIELAEEDDRRNLTVWQQGASRVLALTRFIPKGWARVRVTTVDSHEGVVILRFERIE